MARRIKRGPAYVQLGFAPAGKGLCRCPGCGEKITTNALGRASHVQRCEQFKAKFTAKIVVRPGQAG